MSFLKHCLFVLKVVVTVMPCPLAAAARVGPFCRKVGGRCVEGRSGGRCEEVWRDANVNACRHPWSVRKIGHAGLSSLISSSEPVVRKVLFRAAENHPEVAVDVDVLQEQKKALRTSRALSFDDASDPSDKWGTKWNRRVSPW